jgi:uncharacterized membrane protein HdeD (DUF308 family)
MGVQTAGRDTSYSSAVEERGSGWVGFAGVLLLILGALNLIEGIAAIDKSHFFVGNTHYIAGSLNTWGWVATIIGASQLLVGLGIFARNQFARWLGVLVLGLNSISALMMIPAYPFWSLCIFTLDVLGIYGLVTYGSKIPTARY